MSLSIAGVRKHLLALTFDERAELAREVLDSMTDIHRIGAAAAGAAWEAIEQRVTEIRNGAPITGDLKELLADLDHGDDAYMDGPFDDVDEDPAGVEAAWAEEIRLRIDEIRDGTAKTYSTEDVMTALRLRLG